MLSRSMAAKALSASLKRMRPRTRWSRMLGSKGLRMKSDAPSSRQWVSISWESSLVITKTGTDDSRLLPCTRCSSSSPVMVGMTKSSSMREMSL